MKSWLHSGHKAFVAVLFAALLIPSFALANNPGSMPVTGLGLSAEYAYNEEHEHDGALYLSGRYGFIWMVSGFLTADAGYRFADESLCGKAGVSGMILFWGLEAGFAGAVRSTDKEDAADEGREFVPGMYAGLNAVLPHEEYPVFVSAGACLFFAGREHELYVMVTGLFNFE